MKEVAGSSTDKRVKLWGKDRVAIKAAHSLRQKTGVHKYYQFATNEQVKLWKIDEVASKAALGLRQKTGVRNYYQFAKNERVKHIACNDTVAFPDKISYDSGIIMVDGGIRHERDRAYSRS